MTNNIVPTEEDDVFEEYTDDLEEEYSISSIVDKDEVIKKIIELNCDREKINKWIEESINKNIPLQPSEIFTDIISISGKLYEGSLSQQLKIIFKNNILKDEITKCTLININDNLQNVTSIPTISSKNQKQAANGAINGPARTSR